MKCEKAEVWSKEADSCIWMSENKSLTPSEIQIHIYNMEVTASHKSIRRFKYDNLLSSI